MQTTETIIGKDFKQKVVPLIDEAKKSIKIVVFDWRWYLNDPGNPVSLFNQAIVRARRRGVEVKALVNSDEVVKILNKEGCLAKKLNSPNLLHIKMILIDDVIAVVGSHNYTQSAFTMNFELSVIVRGPENLSSMISYFRNLYN